MWVTFTPIKSMMYTNSLTWFDWTENFKTSKWKKYKFFLFSLFFFFHFYIKRSFDIFSFIFYFSLLCFNSLFYKILKIQKSQKTFNKDCRYLIILLSCFYILLDWLFSETEIGQKQTKTSNLDWIIVISTYT